MRALRQLGLHPLVAFAMVCADLMLTASDLVTVATVSIAVAAALTVPCVLLQRYAYKDGWGVAIGKGLIVGVLTAIPTPLPSVVTGAGGVLGLIGLLGERKAPPRLGAPGDRGDPG
ncbi:MAG: hypothetical protein IT372_30140 [Polyangiaceae bacterium]|nr:hypothetical protein [Polyangiaceae bacterium]